MRGEKGFTLIELLVVIAIVGILATIALYQFASYKGQAHCSQVESDVKNTVISQESVYASKQAYDTTTVVKTGSNNIASDGNDPVTVTGSNANCKGGATFTFTGSDGKYVWP